MFGDYEARRMNRPNFRERSFMGRGGNLARRELRALTMGALRGLERAAMPFIRATARGLYDSLPVNRLFPEYKEFTEVKDGPMSVENADKEERQTSKQIEYSGPSYVPPFNDEGHSETAAIVNRRKFLDSNNNPPDIMYINDSNTTFSGTFPNAAYLCMTRAGSQLTSRIGRTIYVKSLRLRLDFNSNFAVNFISPTATIRICLILDRNPDPIALPSTSQIFKHYDNQMLQQSDPSCFTNPDNHDRFEMIRDHFISLPWYKRDGAAKLIAMGEHPLHWETYIKLNPYIKISYNTDGVPSFGQITKNSLFLAIYTVGQPDDGLAGNPIPNWSASINFRMRFVDHADEAVDM